MNSYTLHVALDHDSEFTLQRGMWLWNHDSEFARWQHPAMWQMALG